MGPKVEVCLLGREVVRVDGRMNAIGPVARALLALLAARQGEPMATHELVRGVYGPNAVDSDRDSLRKAIYRLRRIMGSDAIIHEGSCYRLNVAACDVDAVRFERLVDQARDEPDPLRRGAVLSEALSLWHGAAFAPQAPPHPALAAADARLRELRDGAMHSLAAAQLESGASADAVAVQRRRSASPDLPASVRALRSQADLVGRAHELETLATAHAQSGTEGLRIVLVSGEAGIGKTRLVAEAAARAARDGARVLFANAIAVGGAARDPLRRVAVDVLAELPDAEREQRLRGQLRRLFDAQTSGEAPVGGNVAQERIALRAAIAGLLADAAPEGGLFVVLDDLHEAPVETWLALEHLAVERPDARCCLVATMRTPNRTAGPSERLRRTGAVADLRLGGLDGSSVAELFAGFGRPAAEFGYDAKRLVELTAGNPLLAAALAHHAGDALAQGPATDRLARGVKLLLQTLPDRVIDTLAPAATAGMEFTVHVLVAAAAELGVADHEQVISALACAQRAGLVNPDPGDEGRFAWSHQLVQQHVYESARSRRAQLHLAVGRALEALSGADPADPDVLAEHFGQAWPACPTWLAVDYLADAADRARREVDHAKEDHHLTRALRILALESGADQDRYADMLIAAGDARADNDDPQRARAAYQAAARAVGPAGDRNRWARAAIGYSETFGSRERDHRAQRLLCDSLERPPDDAMLAAGLLRQLDLIDAAAARGRIAHVIDAGSADYRFSVLIDQWTMALGARRQAIGEEIAKIAAGSGDDIQLATALILDWITQFGSGAATIADPERERVIADAVAHSGDYELAWRWHSWSAARAVARGQFEQAHRLTQLARTLRVPGAPHEWAHRFRAARAAGCAAMQDVVGQIARGTQLEAGAATEAMRSAPRWRGLDPSYVLISAPGKAATSIEDALTGIHAADPTSSQALAAAVPLARAAASLGHAAAIRTVERVLYLHLGTHAVPGPAVYLGPVDLWAGQLALAAGKLSPALAYLDNALRMARDVGALVFEIAAERWLATALWRRGSGDYPAAQRRWRHANDAAAAIGMGATPGAGPSSD